MKKTITFLVVLLCIVSCFTACGSKSNSTGTGNGNHDYGTKYNSTNNSAGGSNNLPHDFYIMDYLKNSGSTPIILYRASGNKLSKDSIVDTFYVFENGKCLTYRNYYSAFMLDTAPKITLGSLAKMTDEEIITMLRDIYQEELKLCFDRWTDYSKYEEAFKNGTAKLYSHVPMDFDAYIETDDSGNVIENEVLVLPLAGIDNNACVMYYPSFYFDYLDATLFNGEFHEAYFSWPEKLTCVCDVYTLSKDNSFVSGVYDSMYYGYNQSKGLIFFRHANASTLNVKLDEMNSKYITHIDPTDEQLISLSSKHYDAYFKNFKVVSESDFEN